MLGRLLDPLYPSVEQRAPLPPLYTPGALAVLVLGHALGPGPLRTSASRLALLLLLLARPCFTTGNVSTDYSRTTITVAWMLLLLDLGGGATAARLRYVGKPSSSSKPATRDGDGSSSVGVGVGYGDLTTWPQRLRWGARLASTTRGIGWDWQVKGVPAHPAMDQARWAFVGTSLVDLAWHSVLKALAVYGIGFCRTLQQQQQQQQQPSIAVASPLGSRALLLDAVIAWCGAAWGWHTVGLANALGAVVAVGLGLSEPWECPPMLDSLWNGWSVRHMWSSAYHQMLRRVLQQPGIRAARFMGFRKGTLASRYLQLYLAFFISFGLHWWAQYTITRRDKGEFAFFMMQPVVITAEDFAQWLWGRTVTDPKRKEGFRSLERFVGYVWTFAAFTATLHPYVQGMTGTGVIGGSSPDESAALWLGQQHGAAYLQS
ncbi:hypothetical protein SLS62_009624 [Diatrype stigma]|uniref:Wax synthase domain-containing protein n=1 Tax=Diatrype stigma TaxID=117547 RepID=A0AAN9YI17_9PEZI